MRVGSDFTGAAARHRSCCEAGFGYQMTAVAIMTNTVAAVSKLNVSEDVIVASYFIND